MRPEKARSKINAIFSLYHTKVFDIRRTAHELQKARPELERMLVWFKRNDPDTCQDNETYGFNEWQETLNYLSDRWTNCFRVQWILDILDKLEKERRENEMV